MSKFFHKPFSFYLSLINRCYIFRCLNVPYIPDYKSLRWINRTQAKIRTEKKRLWQFTGLKSKKWCGLRGYEDRRISQYSDMTNLHIGITEPYGCRLILLWTHTVEPWMKMEERNYNFWITWRDVLRLLHRGSAAEAELSAGILDSEFNPSFTFTFFNVWALFSEY